VPCAKRPYFSELDSGTNGKREVASGRSYKALAPQFCEKMISLPERRRGSPVEYRSLRSPMPSAHEVSMLAMHLPGPISQTWRNADCKA
jgi:hypothetical protein